MGLGRDPRKDRWLIGIALVAAALVVAPATASAATITVANTNDSGTGSLRQAVEVTAGANDTVVVPAGTYKLTIFSLNVDEPITIRGAGARKTIIESVGPFRTLFVGATGVPTITGVTITGGDPSGGPGAGIFASSSLVLDDVAVVDNNTDPAGLQAGGGVYLANDTDSLTVRDSLIARNSNYNGGGIYAAGALTVTNSTITNNTAGDPDENGWGGGIQAYGAIPVTIRNTTIAGNRDFGADPGDLPESAAGLYTQLDDPPTVRNTIVAGNTSFDDNGQPAGSAGNLGVANNCSDTYMLSVTQDHNLESETDCLFAGAGSQQNEDPNLAALADNGGETDTMALPAGSPALDRGSGCEAADQRGLSRSLGGPCDLGAYERVLCGGLAVNLFGTAAKDKLTGTAKADGILGLGGNDLLKGLGGNDSLCGAGGRDRLLGGKGRDKLLGGKGRDRLRGGPGRDRLRGGPGRDSQRQ